MTALRFFHHAPTRLLAAAIVFCLGTLEFRATSFAQGAPEREVLLDLHMDEARTLSRITSHRIWFEPGLAAPRHSHSTPVVGIVTKGEFLIEVEGAPVTLFSEGDVFYEPAEIAVPQFSNASETAPAEIVVFYLTDGPESVFNVLGAAEE